MVRGLDQFRNHFSAYTDHYALIGGTACMIAMEEVGLEFRATKDLDIVLCVEAFDDNFVSTLWEFIKKGKYKHKQKSSGKEVFYRFNAPEEHDFPSMIELFSKKPDCLKIAPFKSARMARSCP